MLLIVGDLMTYAIWRWTEFDHHRVFGLGTSIATSYLRNEMALYYDTSPEYCEAILSGMELEPSTSFIQINLYDYLNNLLRLL